ncbi:spore coat polysaccharide biosynthesis protein, predicted glycosyltransferase [Thiorhodovibrio frisius]|uniref:Spore coat polysaccharide biosynthesis protein, predicted glycosyltransferase n=2 Tax=Thiorhodovibrio frisius TaxID=631362 RepID=H8Z0A1_9GAMM|nr:spore coat polysaccharide biosynthesis protein, predicted glycosyltransferase [Thiorhodovibrio frisius]WPL24606.1 pseudaminic acid biosynthesis-associated protein PseG [Thiorhodovibrio frisius]
MSASSDLAILIPAIKKNVAFADDLVKKLAGVSLIQRAIDKAVTAFSLESLWVLTDSEEIRLIADRNGAACLYEPTLHFDTFNQTSRLLLLDQIPATKRDFLILSPYVPLIGIEQLQQAYCYYVTIHAEMLVPVLRATQQLYSPWPRTMAQTLHSNVEHTLVCESRAFVIAARNLLDQPNKRQALPTAYPMEGRLLEIRGYEDWWLCEKLLNRRRIVFRVIGNKAVGMGHIFRALTLAHEITDHEIRFVCDTDSSIAANKLAGYDYWLGVYAPEKIEQAIIDLQPDLVINDILNTQASAIRRLQAHKILVLNFEDLGSGAAIADLTINDLYDKPQCLGANILWGHKYFFVRDEFNDAQPQKFAEQVSRLLIAFGGTDPNHFTQIILNRVAPYCIQQGIAIDIVTGEGYDALDALQAQIASYPQAEIVCTHGTGVITQIMERCQLAIVSNGRTVYELAHMNIPALVIPHHQREKTHGFACPANGFIPIDLDGGEGDAKRLCQALARLVEDCEYRRTLFECVLPHQFCTNKHQVIKIILTLLEFNKHQPS